MTDTSEADISSTLLEAAATGDVEAIRSCISAGANLSQIDRNGLTPLHLAIVNNHEEVALMLIAAKADVDAQDKPNRVPLHLAASTNNLNLVRALLAAGASPERLMYTREGETPLYFAVKSQNVEMVNLIMEHKVFVHGKFGVQNSNLLHIAAVGGNPQIIQVLIDAGVDVSAAERYTSYTPLHIAIMYGHEAAALALIKANSDVSATALRRTPLHMAATMGSLVLVKALLLAGADGWARSVNLFTPIHCASQNNHKEVVAYLAEVLNVTEPHKRCWTTLHDSIYNGHSQSVHIMSFLEEGASVSAVDWSDHTPLHIAAIEGSDGKIVQLLLDNGADIDAKEIQGKTPLEVAKFWPNRSLLRKEGAT